MTSSSLAAIVLAAGKGTRMRSALPKVMHPIAGKTMLAHVLDTLAVLRPSQIIVVVGPEMPTVEAAAAPHPVVLQAQQLGTGHAVAVARLALRNTDTVLVAYGDTPLLTPETLIRLVEERRRSSAAVVVLGMRPEDPGAYGRLILDADGNLEAIVEVAEASPEQRAITLCNSGVMAIAGAEIWPLIERIEAANSKGEYYLTDIVGIARARGLLARVVEAPADELGGVNSRADQAVAEAILQQRLRARIMAGGASLIDPATVYFCTDTKIGRDVVIGPNVVFGPGVVIGDDVEIRAFSHIEGAVVDSGSIIGPFARLRPGTIVGEGAHVGNFVELKNARLGPSAKANHLTYLGDCEIGPRSNIGAGTITCNYDGYAKHRTTIGADVFVGSDTAFVAPVTVGDGAITAAGSVITEDIPADALAIGRARQTIKSGKARAFRVARSKNKGSGA